ncbi:unnamed protein product [Thelazia callipaeda]|uniref:Metalloendopeptidase n=1 Tax=Thelazia callipaeda TaxID=103827 RepID=A0A158RCA2_THECL|nr:unnamed protein product [Thelazia callipaeda]
MLIDLQLTSFFVLLFGLFSISAINIKYEDIIHENEPEEETTLSADDFAKAPKEEIDLKLLGIETKLDPTMGNKTEGDIAVPNVREFDDRISRLGRSAVRGIYRPDRDKFIEILWQNVMPGAEDQFDKHSFWILDTLNEPYDYSSIMHYGPYAFTGNGRRTIIATKPDDECVDKSWKCIFVSIADYCQLDDEIANNICRKSCGNCRNQPIKKKPKINKPEEGPVTRQLPKLTSTTSIYTDRTMLITTATTITTIVNTNITVLPDKSAENTVQDCHDFDGSCAFWAENGGCSNYFLRTFMKTICLQYCEYCLDGNSYERSNKTPKTAKLCNDQASYIVCKLALLFDECDEKVNVCAETCGAC